MTDVILDALKKALEFFTPTLDAHNAHQAYQPWESMERRVANLTTAIAAREAEAWQPIETAPANELIECYSPGNPKAVMRYPREPYRANDRRSKDKTFDDQWGEEWGEEWPEAPYTHWRPLPPPPEAAP